MSQLTLPQLYMRLVHLSDIHLSKQNFQEFKNNYRDALLKDLESYHRQKKIDLLIITGDLIDKGGFSLFDLPEYKDESDPYVIFEKEFIFPIIERIGIDKNDILFIPGNHDIDENQILWVQEKKMKSSLKNETVNGYLNTNHGSFNETNIRIQKFKEFEKRFHTNNSKYNFSNNQSSYVYTYNAENVGILLVNDSWRCSTCRIANEEEGHFFGVQQLYDGLEELKKYDPIFNICLFHHSLNDFREKDEVKRVLHQSSIGLVLFGHYHTTAFFNFYEPYGSCKMIRGRTALNKPDEINAAFKPGYQIIDFDLGAGRIQQIHFRKYQYAQTSFVGDTDIAPSNGVDSGEVDSSFFTLNMIKKSQSPVFNINDFKVD